MSLESCGAAGRLTPGMLSSFSSSARTGVNVALTEVPVTLSWTSSSCESSYASAAMSALSPNARSTESGVNPSK